MPPTAQQTDPAAFPSQSSGSAHAQSSEPVMGHVAPASSHVEPVPPLGASQHSCPAAQWTAPVAVNGQYVPGVVSGWSTGAVPQLGPESTGAAASSPGVVGLHSAAAVADAAAQSVHDTHAIRVPPEKTMLAEHAPPALVWTQVP